MFIFGKVSGIEFSGGHNFMPGLHIKRICDDVVFNKHKKILIHNYFPIPEKSFILNFASSEQEIITRSLDLAIKAFNLCKQYNVPYYSFHPGYLYNNGYEKNNGHFEFIKESYIKYEDALSNFLLNFDKLYKIAKSKGIVLVIENLFIAPGNVKTSLNCSPEEIDELILRLPEDVGLLIDLGHLNISSHYLGFDRDEFIRRILAKHSSRIYEVHLSSNAGIEDDHLPITSGDWQLEALKEISMCCSPYERDINVTIEARKLSNIRLRSAIEAAGDYLQ